MGSPTSPTVAPSAEPTKISKPRGRHLVAFLALISLVTIFALDAYAGGDSKGGPLVSAPIWLPYLFVILRLRGKKPKSGLALAIAMSFAMFLPAAWLIRYARSWDADWRTQAGLILATAVQPILAVAAILAWRSLPPNKGQWRTIIANAAYAVIALIILTSFLWDAPNRIAEDERNAIWLLQTIQKAASSYSTQFGVYPAHLTALNAAAGDEKPNCSAASLLTLAVSRTDPDSFESRGWGGGYIFEYEAGPSLASSGGCVGAKTYRLRARPKIFGKTGRRSFLVDESGALRSTSENQPPTQVTVNRAK